MSDEEKDYLLKLFRWLLAWERRIWTLLRPLYYRSMLRIRAIVAALPDSPLTRQLQWRMQQRQISQELLQYNDAFARELSLRLVELEPGTRKMAADYLGIAPPTGPLATAEAVMRSTRVLQQTLTTLFTIPPSAQESPFIRQHRLEINRVVEAGFLTDTPSAQLANEVVATITRRGETLPVNRPGTALNRMRARAESVIAAATWDRAGTIERQVWVPAAPERWRWQAVLDPKTCPICAPLDGREESNPDAFPYRPPVHPHCRCVVMPIWRT